MTKNFGLHSQFIRYITLTLFCLLQSPLPSFIHRYRHHCRLPTQNTPLPPHHFLYGQALRKGINWWSFIRLSGMIMNWPISLPKMLCSRFSDPYSGQVVMKTPRKEIFSAYKRMNSFVELILESNNSSACDSMNLPIILPSVKRKIVSKIVSHNVLYCPIFLSSLTLLVFILPLFRRYRHLGWILLCFEFVKTVMLILYADHSNISSFWVSSRWAIQDSWHSSPLFVGGDSLTRCCY